jgi:phospholipid transport system substrate-binding protein
MKYFGLLLSVIIFLPATLSANPSGPYPPYYEQQAQTSSQHPGIVLREGIEKVLAFLEGGGANNRDKLVNFVERELAGYFDFISMSRMSLGPRARFMSREQRKEAVSYLRGMFLNALVRQLAAYEPGRVQYLPPRGNRYSNEMMLTVRTYARNGYPHQLDFYFYRGRDGWKVYDVAANGLKATSVYREQFNQRHRKTMPPGYTRR